MTTNDRLKSFEKKMEDSIISLNKDLSTIRTGRAHSSMLDLVKVDVYGQSLPINQIGTISISDPQTLSIQVWDSNNVKFCEKAIRESDLNLNPIVDGQLLRIPVPKLNEDRRKELSKIVGQQSEKIKISIRNIRRNGMDYLKEEEKNKNISEDESKKLSNDLQKLTDEFVKKIEIKIKEKEQEILKI
ncbi:MAG: ribosome recycling factor [Pelagibacteraceae bacterium]|nr:ribosome recycling factor [Pelagibacteraceae bacterium]OUV89275.1 MAG: ribosome recycling factor [Pelagibacteraceae bacterium TMED146]|tara:strand:+ start:3807 stop:4367 length:561 start_codon:yes stop_codon:yes gene_type:complete